MISRDCDAYQNALAWLVDRIDYEKLASPGARYRFTLDRMRDLMRRLGHGDRLAGSGTIDQTLPDQTLSGQTFSAEAPSKEDDDATSVRVVHVAGTKGKGSTTTMVAALLQSAGYRVGLYTSPHLMHLEERFRVDGQPAFPAEMVSLIDSMRPVVESMAAEPIGGPSFFELTTAIAIEHFHRHECDVWVLETGLGGRLDSTNVFQSHVTAITSIGLDHQHVLGDTAELIAAQKAGIFKSGVPAMIGVAAGSVRDVITDVARNVGAPLRHLDDDIQIRNASTDTAIDWGSRFQVDGLGDWLNSNTTIDLRLEGDHQIRNAALALSIVDALPGVSLSRSKVNGGPPIWNCLANLQVEARLERFDLSDNRVVILDAAHNPDSIAAMLNVLSKRFQNRRLLAVFGTSLDKDAAVMLRQMRPHVHNWFFTRYQGNPRSVPTDQLRSIAGEVGLDMNAIQFIEHPLPACQAAMDALSPGDVMVICGSFFLAAGTRPWVLVRATEHPPSASKQETP